MKKLFFLSGLLFAGTLSAQTYEWAFNAEGIGSCDGLSITADAAGNTFVTGSFQNTTDFDPSANIANLTSNGDDDVFIAKYDANGNYLWAFNIGGANNDIGNSITTDDSGNVYVTGSFIDTVDFDPSVNTVNLISPGGLIKPDIFIAKYDVGGNYLWAFNIGAGGEDEGYDITTDYSGSVFVIGWFQGIADFDPSGNTANLSADGWNDLFVAKYDTGGNYLWAFNLGGNSSDYGYGISTDTSGNVIVTGYFQNLVDFDKSGNVANINSNGNADVFIAKYDANANYLWAFNIGGTVIDVGYGLTTDVSGNVYITGSFQDTADFDPSANTVNLTADGWNDLFVAKYDTGGNYLWAFNAGGTGGDAGKSITIDVSGDVYVTGRFANVADFDPSANTANLTSNGVYDVFLARYDATGNYIWAFNIGGTSNDIGNSIATDVSGDVYLTGSFQNTADFDPSANTANLTSNGGGDIFVAKYSDAIGMSEIHSSNPFVVFPNPTKGKFRVESLKFGVETIEIYDLFGRLVLRTNKPEIDMSEYAKGVYVLRIGEATRKIILQ